MSSQLYEALNGKGKKKVEYDATTNDLFALGMSILTIGTGNSVQAFYGPDGKLDWDFLSNQVNDFQTRFLQQKKLVEATKELIRRDGQPSAQRAIDILSKVEQIQEKPVATQ